MQFIDIQFIVLIVFIVFFFTVNARHCRSFCQQVSCKMKKYFIWIYIFHLSIARENDCRFQIMLVVSVVKCVVNVLERSETYQ